MNAKNLLASLNVNLKTVNVQFKDMNGEPFGKQYTYKTDLDLKVGDSVVVDAPSTGLTVVVVSEVHILPELGGGYDYQWIVCKVDTDAHAARLEKDAEMQRELELLMLKQSRVKAIEQLKRDLGFAEDEECEELTALIAKITA